MRMLLTLALLALSIPQTQPSLQDGSGLQIVGLSVKEKVITHKNWSPGLSNKPPVIKPDLGRGTDRNEPEIQKIQRDTAQRTAELRMLETNSRSGRVGRFDTPYAEPGYEFHAEMMNAASRSIASFVWAYRPSLTSPDIPDQEFLCNVRIKPGEAKVFKVLFPIPRARVVSAQGAGTPPISQNPSLKDMVVNKVQFSDGTTWQRTDWNPIILSRQGAKKISKGKCVAL